MIIAHNMLANNAHRQFNIVNDKKMKATEKLSSGYRINRAGDDAAGLSISEKMRAQIRGLDRASDNVQEGISYVQVADGAMEEVHQMLQRIRELSVKSANDTNTASDRLCIDNEVQELKKEIDRVFKETEFNTQKIWEGTQVPVSTIVVDKDETTTFPSVVFKSMADNIGLNNTNSMAIPSSSIKVAADDAGITFSWTGYDGIQYKSNTVDWDLDNLSGTHAIKLSNYMDYSKYPSARGLDFTYTYDASEYATKAELIKAFNKSEASPNSYVTNPVSATLAYTNSSDPKPFSIGASIDYAAMLASGKDFQNFDTSFIEFSSIYNPAAPGGDPSKPFSFTFTMPNIGNVTANLNTAYYYGTYNINMSDKTGENIWWKEYKLSTGQLTKQRIEYNIDGSPNSIMDAIGNGAGHSLWFDNSSGGTVYLQFSLKADTPYRTLDGKTSSIVGSFALSVNVNKSYAANVTDLQNYIKAGLANLSKVDIEDQDNVRNDYLRVYRTSNRESTVLSSNTIHTSHEEHDYITEEVKRLHIQAGPNTAQSILIEYENMNINLLGLDETNVLDYDSSQVAIADTDIAIQRVSAQRSLFGAYQNRLEHVKMINDNVSENTSASESRIRDTNMAKEMVDFSRQNILEQLGTSIIAQANQSVQGVVGLLR